MRSFQVLSIAAIIRRERHDSPMTDEERQRAMDFIVAQQAKNSVDIDKLIEAQRRAELRFERDEFRLDRDERILKLVISAGRRERRTRSAADERLTKALAVLAESQAHTDNRLDALIDIVQQQRNGG
jgi:hypothetical protein